MRPLVGRAALVLSAAGYPLTEAVIRRFGRPGATVVAAVCLGLLARDTVLIGRGTPRVLRRVPATLLWLEAGAAAATLKLVGKPDAFRDAGLGAPGPQAVRRSAVAAPVRCSHCPLRHLSHPRPRPARPVAATSVAVGHHCWLWWAT
jgi:hypothetical protein